MDSFTYRLLTHLKLAFENSCGHPRYECEDSGPSVTARQFYVRDLADNLVRPMAERHVREYARGSGDELKGKMRALRSSSAMTYNVLGNEWLAVREPRDGSGAALAPGRYRIAYEAQFPTLRRGLPANLDALLDDKADRTVACEMKFLEWVSGDPRSLRAAYTQDEAYRSTPAAEAFVPVGAQLNEEHFTRYDYAQMFKHALALYNACAEGCLPGTTTLLLLNVVWEPPARSAILTDDDLEWLHDAIARERREFGRFAELMQPVCGSFENLGVRFSIAYMPVADLISIVEYPAEERRKLARYMG